VVKTKFYIAQVSAPKLSLGDVASS